MILKVVEKLVGPDWKITKHVYDNGLIYKIITNEYYDTWKRNEYKLVDKFSKKYLLSDDEVLKFIKENEQTFKGESKSLIQQLERDIKLKELL